MLTAIILSSVALAIEHPMDNPESVKIRFLVVFDLLFVIFFTFEMILKMLGVMNSALKTMNSVF